LPQQERNKLNVKRQGVPGQIKKKIKKNSHFENERRGLSSFLRLVLKNNLLAKKKEKHMRKLATRVTHTKKGHGNWPQKMLMIYLIDLTMNICPLWSQACEKLPKIPGANGGSSSSILFPHFFAPFFLPFLLFSFFSLACSQVSG